MSSPDPGRALGELLGMFVKICGITRGEDARLAVELGASAVGFVFWPASPRFIHPDAARAIVSSLPPFVTTVGVFVDEAPERVQAIARHVGLSAVQLHGAETPEYVARSRAAGDQVGARGRGVARSAGRVAGHGDAAGRCRRRRRAREARAPGADWAVAARMAARRPLILAGGLRRGQRGAGDPRGEADWRGRVVGRGARRLASRTTPRCARFFEAVAAGDERRRCRPSAGATRTRAATSARSAAASSPRRWSRRSSSSSRPISTRGRTRRSRSDCRRLLANYAGRPTPLYEARAARRARPAARASSSSARTSRTPARTRSTTRSARRCSRRGWGSRGSIAETGAASTASRRPRPARCSACGARSTWAPTTWRARRSNVVAHAAARRDACAASTAAAARSRTPSTRRCATG